MIFKFFEMKKTIFKICSVFSLSSILFFVNSCQDSIDTVNSPVPYEAIGGYSNSDDISPNNLLVKLSFENNLIDTKGGVTGGVSNGSISYDIGRKGNAYKGSNSGFASYTGVSDGVKNLKSITQSMWFKTTQHTGGAQSIFMLPKTTDFWGNIFVLLEGGTDGKMQIKFHIQKDVTPAIAWSGQWIDFGGTNKLENMYGQWKHLVWSYNENTSTFSIYVDGTKLNISEGFSKRWTNDPTAGGVPLGALSNSNVSKFIIGGYQQHLGSPWSAPDGWMLNYTGLLDEFRIYNTALSDTDVKSLYLLEKDGR